MAQKKIKTNNDMVKALVKELDNSHPLLMAIFRERLVKVADLTKQSIKKDPKAFENPFFTVSMYEEVNNLIYKHCNFETNG